MNIPNINKTWQPFSHSTGPLSLTFFSWQEMLYRLFFRDFLKLWLGPALKNSSITKNLKVMIMDDQRTLLPDFPNTVTYKNY